MAGRRGGRRTLRGALGAGRTVLAAPGTPETVPPSRPPRAGERPGAEADSEAYEDDPPLPWWDTPADEPNPRPPGRIALYAALAVLLALALVGAALIGAVTLP